jgi:hypothetical protein
MASAAEQSSRADAPERSTRREAAADQSRLLPVLAVKRVIRAALLIGVGLILLTHAHTDWRISHGALLSRSGSTRAATRPAG